MSRHRLRPALIHSALRQDRLGANWWEVAGKTCVAAYQPIGAVDIAASYINLANPGTYNAAPGTAPTFAAATGWTFNGSTQYLTTGVVPVSGSSMAVRFSGGAGTVLEFVAGLHDSDEDNRFYLMPRYTFDSHYYGYGDSARLAALRLASGIMAIAASNCYLDGASEGTTSGTWNNTLLECYIGAQNSKNGAVSHFGGTIQAVAIYSDTLTAPQVATLSTAMAALT